MLKEVRYPPLERSVEPLIRRSEVEAITSMSSSEIYRRMDRGEFPRPIRIGATPRGAVAWRLSEVTNWMDRLPVADPKDFYRT